ncbi:MAG: sigma-70 family RNA polymerase sigma factor [Lachnospiraceae bacterium]|nr:sigma-70 family RNA polymerase sigma factor [Lachnospiraceae bacterium]
MDTKKYSDVKDEVLVERLRDGESEVESFLLDKYKNLVKVKAHSMFILGAEPDDLIQEGMIGLVKAIRDYDAGRDASFYTFADLCVSRQIYTAVKASGRKKHMPLNTYVSISSENDSENGGEIRTSMARANVSNPEAMLIDKENVEKIENYIENELSDFERQALELYITGMNYSAIAKVLGKEEKATDNALTRAKSKLRKFLDAERN